MKTTDYNNDMNDDLSYRDDIEVAFQYLATIQSPSKFVDDKGSMKAFASLSTLARKDYFGLKMNEFKSLQTYEIERTFAQILEYSYFDVVQFVESCDSLESMKELMCTVRKAKKTYLLVHSVLLVINKLTEKSDLSCLKFYKWNGGKILLDYISNQNFLKNCKRFKGNEKTNEPATASGFELLELLIRSFKNLTRLADNVSKKAWVKLQAQKKLAIFFQEMITSPNLFLFGSLAMMNIINEETITSQSTLDLVMGQMNKLVNKAATDLQANENFKREMVTMTDENNKTYETGVLFVEFNDAYFNIVQVMDSLNKLAVCDRMKKFMYMNGDLKDSLKLIIMHGNEVEKEYATKLVWQMSFNREVAEDVNKDSEMLYYIENVLLDEKKVKHQELRKNCKGILWEQSKFKRINNKENEAEVAEEIDEDKSICKKKSAPLMLSAVKESVQVNESAARTGKGHIMISYNSYSREICLRIKAELEKVNLKVWIDVENISGSSLESMANAIENADCVIICMTEKYKLSPNCRAECEYTFNLRKPFVPLIMEAGYVPDGWLGIVLGTKIYIDFTKNPFENCFGKLRKEIINVAFDGVGDDFDIKKIEEITKIPSLPDERTNTDLEIIPKNPRFWKNKDVKLWLDKNKFHPLITHDLKPFNGELLAQLFKIYKNAPQYFFESISKKGKVDLLPVVIFVNELDKIFK